MAMFKCDNCLKEFSEKDKYNKLRCHGECRRSFCMNCTGLDKATSKALVLQKFNHLRYFCSLCDSPNLRYLNDKITNLSKNQIPQEIFDSLANRISQLTSSVPAITEIYDMLLKNETKWNLLEKRIEDIHKSLEAFAMFKPDPLLKSLREMEQNIFNISSIFLNNSEDTIKIQMQDASSGEILVGIENLKINLTKVSSVVNELTSKIDKSIHLNKQHTEVRHSICTASSYSQTESTPEASITTESSNEVVCSKNQRWHYVIISNLPAGSTPNQIVHHIKEKLGSSEFVRCYPLINEKNKSEGAIYKIGLQSRNLAVKLLDNHNNIWPAEVSIKWSSESSVPQKASIPRLMEASQMMKFDHGTQMGLSNTVGLNRPPRVESSTAIGTISSDKHAISACKSNNLADGKSVQFLIERQDDKSKSMDPLTPPIVRLTSESHVGNGRYLLARLREPAILSSLKLFLAYLHDQPASVCHEGYTNTSVKVFLASEGLPTDPEALRTIYYNYHALYGISPVEVDNDLSTYGSFVSAERRIHLQRQRECNSRYFTAVSPKKFF